MLCVSVAFAQFLVMEIQHKNSIYSVQTAENNQYSIEKRSVKTTFHSLWKTKLVVETVLCVFYRLYDVSLQQALLAVSQSANALTIEQCSCPPTYTGLSCQANSLMH